MTDHASRPRKSESDDDGVPAKLGRDGVKEIVEIELDADEQRLMDESAQHVRDNVGNLERIEANACPLPSTGGIP